MNETPLYLYWGLLLQVPLAIGLLAAPDQRRWMLLCAACAAPAGLADYLFVPEYWRPGHLVGRGFSIEGVAFSFGNGGVLWLLAVLPVRRLVVVEFRWRHAARRYLTFMALGFAVFLAVWRRGVGLGALPIMEAAIVALVAVGLVVLARRPDGWPFALAGGIGFAAYYALQLATVKLLAPEAAGLWQRSAVTFLGFPAIELGWAAVYGAVWALAAAYGCNARVRAGARASAA